MPHSIDAVARLTGLSPFTLRNWEKRYGFPRPNRLENGFRAYGDEHVELLKQVAALLRHGVRIGDLADTIRKGKPLPPVPQAELSPEVRSEAGELYASLVQFDLPRADHIHRELEGRYGPEQMLDLVYSPLLARIAHDQSPRFASAFIRQRLAAYLARPVPAAQAGTTAKVVIGGFSTLDHLSHLLLVGAHLRLQGCMVYELGSGLSAEEVGTAVSRIQPQGVCLSFSDRQSIRTVMDKLSQLACPVFIGGFGALTFHDEETLPVNLRLFRCHGREAAELVRSVTG